MNLISRRCFVFLILSILTGCSRGPLVDNSPNFQQTEQASSHRSNKEIRDAKLEFNSIKTAIDLLNKKLEEAAINNDKGSFSEALKELELYQVKVEKIISIFQANFDSYNKMLLEHERAMLAVSIFEGDESIIGSIKELQKKVVEAQKSYDKANVEFVKVKIEESMINKTTIGYVEKINEFIEKVNDQKAAIAGLISYDALIGYDIMKMEVLILEAGTIKYDDKSIEMWEGYKRLNDSVDSVIDLLQAVVDEYLSIDAFDSDEPQKVAKLSAIKELSDKILHSAMEKFITNTEAIKEYELEKLKVAEKEGITALNLEALVETKLKLGLKENELRQEKTKILTDKQAVLNDAKKAQCELNEAIKELDEIKILSFKWNGKIQKLIFKQVV